MKVLGSKGLRSWLAVLLLCMLIFLPSLIRLPMPKGPVLDKVAHFFAYASAGFFVLRGARFLPLGKNRIAAVCFAFLLAAAIGAADEVLQFFVPNRHMDRADFLFDLAGIVSGMCLYLYLWARAERKPKACSHAGRP
jgi:VanZ family protein